MRRLASMAAAAVLIAVAGCAGPGQLLDDWTATTGTVATNQLPAEGWWTK